MGGQTPAHTQRGEQMDKQINNAVRIQNRVYGPGMERQLAGILTPEEAARLLEKKAIQGNWRTATEPVEKNDKTEGSSAENVEAAESVKASKPKTKAKK